MADTRNVKITKSDGWVEVVSGGSGLITASTYCFYVRSNTPPPELLIGHRFGTQDWTEYFLADGEKLWFRADRECVLTITEGVRSKSKIVRNYTEANVVSGVQYEWSGYQSAFSNLTPFDVIIITGTHPVSIKGLVWQFDGLGFSSTLYRNPTYTGGGESVYYNKNTRNPVTGNIKLLIGAVVTNNGTQQGATKTMLGSRENGGRVAVTPASEAQGLETILDANSTYLLRRISIDTQPQRVATYATWYEGELEMPQWVI